MAKYKKKKIPLAVKNATWNTYIGEENGLGYCFICDGVISRGTFACGHVIAEVNGGETTVDNLRPVCPSCNSSQGTRNMEDFKKEYGISEKKENDNIVIIPTNNTKSKKSKIMNRKNRNKIIEENLSNLNSSELKILKKKIIFYNYTSEWRGIENYYAHSILFSPKKSQILEILIKFDKSMLKIICDELKIKYTKKNKKSDLISLIIYKKSK